MPKKKEPKKIYPDEYMEGDFIWMRNMRERGYCIVCFTPEELEGVDPDKVEDVLVEYGWDVIEDLKEEEDDE